MPTSSSRLRLEHALGEQIDALLSATRALTERSAAAFHPGLQPAAFHVARWLHAFGPARPSAVAAAVHMDRSSTSALLARLRDLGLVRNDPTPADGRGVLVSLTDAGHERVAATLLDRGDELTARTERMSDDDLEQLTRLLRALIAPRSDDVAPGGSDRAIRTGPGRG